MKPFEMHMFRNSGGSFTLCCNVTHLRLNYSGIPFALPPPLPPLPPFLPPLSSDPILFQKPVNGFNWMSYLNVNFDYPNAVTRLTVDRASAYGTPTCVFKMNTSIGFLVWPPKIRLNKSHSFLSWLCSTHACCAALPMQTYPWNSFLVCIFNILGAAFLALIAIKMLKCWLLVLIIMYLLPLFHVCHIDISFHTNPLLPSCVFLHLLVVPASAALQITFLSKSQAWLHTGSSSVLHEIIYEVIALQWFSPNRRAIRPPPLPLFPLPPAPLPSALPSSLCPFLHTLYISFSVLK